PFQIFDAPSSYWTLLTATTDSAIESQLIERKRAGNPAAGGTLSSSQLSSLRDQVLESLSAFANANADGGLLAIGISSDGTVLGVDHLTETQLSSLCILHIQLRCYRGRSRLHDCSR